MSFKNRMINPFCEILSSGKNNKKKQKSCTSTQKKREKDEKPSFSL